MCTQNAHLSTSGCINLQCTALNQSNAWFFFFLRKWMHIHYIQDNVRSFNVVDLPTLLLPSSLSLQTNYTQKTLLSDEPFRKNLEDINIHDVFIQLNTDWCTQKRLYSVNQNKVFFCVCKKLVRVTILGIQSKIIGAFLQCS